MRNVESHYGHAELVNRRARIGVVLIPVVAILALLSFDAFGDEGTTEPTVLAALVDGSTSTTAEAAVAAGSDGVGNRPATGTTISQQPSEVVGTSTTTTSPTTTTSLARSTTSTTRPTTTASTNPPPTTTSTTRPPTTTTTTVPPTTTTTSTTTTTVPPTTTTTSTTTTTVPPTTTTTSTTTTTVPPTTTTTVPPNAWFPSLSASLRCDDGQPVIRWTVGDPPDEWSNGWRMVIDGDDRGLFAPGTIVTNNQGPAIRDEAVAPGTHSLRVSVHWELISDGSGDRGFGSFTITRTHDGDCT